MSDLRLVIYKDQHFPRSITLSTRTLYRTLALASGAGLLFLAMLALLVQFYLRGPAKTAGPQDGLERLDSSVGPTNSPEEVIRSLRDEADLYKTRLQNAQALQGSPKEIDSKNPALALFSPNVVDRTQAQKLVNIVNFKVAPGNAKLPLTLTFELHNAGPPDSVQKGYIVVLARAETSLAAYPNVFNKTGAYLLDFERGETFQVARFRLVNAQFHIDNGVKNFQILIFTRTGELLVNSMHEAP